jgi:hypothetical protein
MEIVYWVLGLVIGIPISLVFVMYAASEMGGEVVTLERAEGNGDINRIRVWIVDDNGDSWIEHGDPNSYWINKLHSLNEVVITRRGQTTTYSGTPDPGFHNRYHQLRRIKYAWADELVGFFSGGEMNCPGVPVRLQIPEDA